MRREKKGGAYCTVLAKRLQARSHTQRVLLSNDHEIETLMVGLWCLSDTSQISRNLVRNPRRCSPTARE